MKKRPAQGKRSRNNDRKESEDGLYSERQLDGDRLRTTPKVAVLVTFRIKIMTRVRASKQRSSERVKVTFREVEH